MRKPKGKNFKAKSFMNNIMKDKSISIASVDTFTSDKSNSSIISSLYLLILAVIVLALAVIIGLVSYAYSKNFAQKSNDRFNIRTSQIEDITYSNEDIDAQENDDIFLEGHSDEDDYENIAAENTVIAKPEPKVEEPGIRKIEHRDLFHSYTYDFERAFRLRQEAMKKYSYPYSLDGVDKRSNLSLQEFYDVYDGKWPVIITDLMPNWPAMNWSAKSFKKKYGDARVAMMSYNIRGLPNYQEGKPNKEGYSVPLEIFLDHLNVSNEVSWTYLQDEVFLVQYPELRAEVLDTIYTKEDFFTLFPKEIRPWDCLLLWGTAHSRSTLHIDPYNWTGTNAVISGHKKWKLFPPGQDKSLSIYPDAACGFPLQCQKYNSKYDTFSMTDQMKRKLKKLKYLEVDQMPGEMLFIPTGWFHQAYNVVPTLAVSGEIMNRNNYLAVLEEIFHVGNLPRSVLPQNVEKLSPKDLVIFVMSNMPAKILIQGDEWTKMNIRSLTNIPDEQEDMEN